MIQLAAVLCFSFGVKAQESTSSNEQHFYSDWRLSVLANMDFGLNFASVEKDDNSTWFQQPGTVLTIFSGMGLRHKEKFHFNLGLGGMMDTYNFFSTNASYNITHIYLQLRGNVNYMFPFKSDRTKAIVVGTDFGRALNGYNQRLSVENFHVIRSQTFGPSSNFIAPEIGFGRTWSYGQMSLVLTYHNLFRSNPNFMITIEENNGARFVGRSGGNYLGFKLRANFDIKGHKPPVQHYEEPADPNEAEEMLARETRQRSVYESKQTVARLLVWDDGVIDGDTISISVNGRFVLANHGLRKRKKRVKIVLNQGDNEIVFHAHNEGEIPPNTAAMKIKTGLFTRHRIVISTTMRRNESIIIRHP